MEIANYQVLSLLPSACMEEVRALRPSLTKSVMVRRSAWGRISPLLVCTLLAIQKIMYATMLLLRINQMVVFSLVTHYFLVVVADFSKEPPSKCIIALTYHDFLKCFVIFFLFIRYHALIEILGKLAGSTKVYCGHEYTVKNLEFAKTVDGENKALLERMDACVKMRKDGQFTVPGTMQEELDTNPFMRVTDPSLQARVKATDAVDAMKIVRQMKDRF